MNAYIKYCPKVFLYNNVNDEIEVEISSDIDDGVQGQAEGRNKAISDMILQF